MTIKPFLIFLFMGVMVSHLFAQPYPLPIGPLFERFIPVSEVYVYRPVYYSSRWGGHSSYDPYAGVVSSLGIAGYLVMNAIYAQQRQAIGLPLYSYDSYRGEVDVNPHFGWTEVRQGSQFMSTQTVETTQSIVVDEHGNTKKTTTTRNLSLPAPLPTSTAYPSTLR